MLMVHEDSALGQAKICYLLKQLRATNQYPGGSVCLQQSVWFIFLFFFMSNLEGNKSLLLKLAGYVNAGGVIWVAQ